MIEKIYIMYSQEHYVMLRSLVIVCKHVQMLINIQKGTIWNCNEFDLLGFFNLSAEREWLSRLHYFIFCSKMSSNKVGMQSKILFCLTNISGILPHLGCVGPTIVGFNRPWTYQEKLVTCKCILRNHYFFMWILNF